MRDVTLVILNSFRIKCHIRRPLTNCNACVCAWIKRGQSLTSLFNSDYFYLIQIILCIIYHLFII